MVFKYVFNLSLPSLSWFYIKSLFVIYDLTVMRKLQLLRISQIYYWCTQCTICQHYNYYNEKHWLKSDENGNAIDNRVKGPAQLKRGSVTDAVSSTT
jgi:hypothetical protein